jgi:hypothetical protein
VPAIFGNALITNVLQKQPLGEAFPCCAVMDNIRPFMNTIAGEALRVTGWFPGGNDRSERRQCNLLTLNWEVVINDAKSSPYPLPLPMANPQGYGGVSRT